MTLPTFFIIGAGKAGTTSLNHYLGLHPEIQMSKIKEPNFFAGAENGRPYAMKRVSHIAEYERLFDSAFPVRGEASPTYASHPIRSGAPERIRDLVPDAKFIYIVRDPIERTVSHYQHVFAVGAERRSLDEVLADLSNPLKIPETCYSLYASQVEQYLRYFSVDRLLVVDQAEFRDSRQSTLREIFTFLEVDPEFFSSEFDEELYKSSERRVYPRVYDRFIGRLVVPLVQWIPKGTRQSVRASIERALFRPLDTPMLSAELRGGLEGLYAPDVARLRSLTGRGFPTWSV